MTFDKFLEVRKDIQPNEFGCKIWSQLIGRRVLELKLQRPIKPGYWACHHCDEGYCVTEDHIYEGTQEDNDLDRRLRGMGEEGARQRLALRGASVIWQKFLAGHNRRPILLNRISYTDRQPLLDVSTLRSSSQYLLIMSVSLAWRLEMWF
jgi:hypothetical protein